MIESSNPHQEPASRELDAYIHHRVLKNPLSHHYPNYSADPTAAENLRRTLQQKYKTKIISGRTAIFGKTWFARYELDPGNPTEALAESYALAVCRLAILLAKRT